MLSTADDQSDSAKLAAEAAKNKLEEEKKKFNQLEERLISQSRVPDPPTERLQDPVDPPSELEVVAEEQVNRGLDDAIKAYREELKRDRIPTRQRNIEPFLANLNNGINNVSKALLADSNSVAAWVMKGRFHLSCMELKQAKDSFDMAINASGRKSLKRTQLDVECEKLREICAKLSSVPSSNDRFVEGAKLLVAPGTSAGDHDVAKLLVYLKDKTFAYKTITSPVGRGQTPAESALNIIMDANGTGRIVFTDAGRNGKDLVISGIPKLAKLNLLDSLSPTSIRIYGAETIDIQPLARLPSLESLDLGGCPITQLGPSTPNFRRLKTLSLRDTKITDLSPLRNMTTLETLDLSGLPLVNVVPLFDLRSLSKLTVSPEKFPDKMILIPLKQLTLNHLQKLKVLRAPDDPENQPPTQFWQNFFDKRSRKSQAL